MKTPAVVFLDASAMKRAVLVRTRSTVAPKTLTWGPREITVPVTRFEAFDTTEGIANQVMRDEARLLPYVAELAGAGRLRLQTGVEAYGEFLGLREIDGLGVLDGVQIEMIESPLGRSHSRMMGGGGLDARKLQREFFESIHAPRYLEMRKAFGALKTGSKRSRNLLADIFHVWTADESGADFLLTLDARLCRAVRGQPQLRPRVKVVQPSELITEVPPPSLRWRLARAVDRLRARFKPRAQPDTLFGR